MAFLFLMYKSKRPLVQFWSQVSGVVQLGRFKKFPSSEWPRKLKWFATGVSTSCQISNLWQTVLICSWFWVCPTYCFLHKLHVIKYTTFTQSQFKSDRIWYSVLVCWLMKVDWVFIMLRSLRLVLLQLAEDPVPIHGGQLFWILMCL